MWLCLTPGSVPVTYMSQAQLCYLLIWFISFASFIFVQFLMHCTHVCTLHHAEWDDSVPLNLQKIITLIFQLIPLVVEKCEKCCWRNCFCVYYGQRMAFFCYCAPNIHTKYGTIRRRKRRTFPSKIIEKPVERNFPFGFAAFYCRFTVFRTHCLHNICNASRIVKTIFFCRIFLPFIKQITGYLQFAVESIRDVNT